MLPGRICSISSAKNARAMRLASPLERLRVREPLIGMGISDSSRAPCILGQWRPGARTAVPHGVYRPDSRGFVRVKAFGVLDQHEEDVKMCVTGL